MQKPLYLVKKENLSTQQNFDIYGYNISKSEYTNCGDNAMVCLSSMLDKENSIAGFFDILSEKNCYKYADLIFDPVTLKPVYFEDRLIDKYNKKLFFFVFLGKKYWDKSMILQEHITNKNVRGTVKKNKLFFIARKQ